MADEPEPQPHVEAPAAAEEAAPPAEAPAAAEGEEQHASEAPPPPGGCAAHGAWMICLEPRALLDVCVEHMC